MAAVIETIKKDVRLEFIPNRNISTIKKIFYKSYNSTHTMMGGKDIVF